MAGMTDSKDHLRMLLPYDPPLPATDGGKLPALSSLWDRAKTFFARVIDHIGSTSDFAKRRAISRNEKRELLNWLKPVETIVRASLVTRAITFLLMTIEGRRLLRETPKMAPPEREPEKPAVKSTRIPHPGYHTIWQSPRILAERQKLEQQRAAEAAQTRANPDNWRGTFRIIKWNLGAPEPPPPPPPENPWWVTNIDPEASALRPRPVAKQKRALQKTDQPALVLARRIESLSHILSDPRPAISRLARLLARLPRDAITEEWAAAVHVDQHWNHGQQDVRAVRDHLRAAVGVYCRLLEPG
jgi:hypothetical protein